MAICIFNNCTSVQKPFSSLAFFALPKDYRRQLWIENSGNLELATLSESARRVVCQKHFSPSSLRIQFHRTILSRDAVPDKWNECVEPIEIHYIEGDEQFHDEIINIDDEYVDEDVQQDVNDWQINYENSANQSKEVLEFEHDTDNSSQNMDECAVDNRLTNEIDQCQQINEEDINIIQEELPNTSHASFHEVETKTADFEKRKKLNGIDVTSVEILDQCPDEALRELRERVACDKLAADVIVSSSTNKSDENASGSFHITNEEDKYFSLALVGILQRITPQKKAFAKLCGDQHKQIMDNKVNSDCPLISNGFVSCYSDYLRIHWYFFPFGSKKVRYTEIRTCELRSMVDLGLFSSKLWGMSLTPVWWHCDMNRLGREKYILLDANQWPSIGLTMDDNDTIRVYNFIRQKMNGNTASDNTDESSLFRTEVKQKSA